jgi:hypothetical protein
MANEARLQIVIDALNNAGDELKAIQKDLGGVDDKAKQAGEGLGAAGESAKGAGEGFKVAGLSLTDLKSGVDLAMGGIENLKQVWDFAKEGAENQRVARSFQETAESVGVSAEMMSEALNKAAHGTVDDEAYMQIATRNMALGMATDLKSNVQLMELARSASIKFGGDTETAFEGISTAIGNLQTRQLKQYGIIVDAKSANETYAKALGKTADQLTEAEQRTALLNEVMDKSKVVFKGAGDAAETTGEKMKRVETTLGNLVDGFKELMATGIDTGITLLEGPASAMDAFTGTATNMRAEVLAGRMTLKDYEDGLAGMAQAMRDGGLVVPVITYNLYQLTDAEIAATQGAYGYAGALDEGNRATKRAAESQKNALSGLQKQTQYTHDALEQYYSSTLKNSEASKEFSKWLSEGVAAKMSNLSTVMAGAIQNENKQYIDQEQTLAEKAAKLKDEIDKLSASQGRAITTTSKATMTDTERAAIQAKLAVVNEDLALQERKKNETDVEFASRMATNAATAETLTGKLNGAATAVQGYVDNSKKIGELKGQYDDINAEIEANAAKHEDATNRILYGYLQQEIAANVAEGKMTATEGFDAAMSAAIELGVVSAEDATAIGKVGSALDTALFTKDWKGLGTAIKEALNPPVVTPPVAEYYANMYDASRKGFKAPEVDTSSIDAAQEKFDALSISTAARNFPIEFEPITKTLTEATTTAGNTQIALDAINGTKGRDMTVPYIGEIDVTLKNAKTSADFLRGSLDLIKSKEVTVKVNYVSSGNPPGDVNPKDTKIPGRALGGPTGQGGLFMLHPNEFVLSEAMRMGRAPIPAEAVPSRGVMGTAQTTNVYNLYDTLTAKMVLEKQRMNDLAELEARM